jgi:hypothetical protein
LKGVIAGVITGQDDILAVSEQVDNVKATSVGVTKTQNAAFCVKDEGGRKKFSRSRIKVHYSSVANDNQNTRWLLRCDDFPFVNHTRSRRRCVVGVTGSAQKKPTQL